jgi:UDP-glucose 4-epimerase
MRVLITGGAGFIGSHLADAFLGRGDQVVIVDDLSRGRPNRLAPQAILHKASIGDAVAFRDICREINPDLICHLAAQIDVRHSVMDPVHDATVNVVYTINVLEAAHLVGARVIFASSAGALYGSEAPVPSPEDTSSSPGSPYGAAKVCAEQYVGLYNRLYGARHSVLRFSNVYGPRQDPYGEAGVIAVFCASVLAGDTPVIYGDGKQTRDYVYVGDVVRSFLNAADYESPGTWNIGTGIETTVLDLVATIADIAGRRVVPRHAAPRLGELHRSAVVAERAALDLGWRPTVTLREGMQAVYWWMQAETPDRVVISVV